MKIKQKLEIDNLTIIKEEDDVQFYTRGLKDSVPIYYRMKSSDISEIRIDNGSSLKIIKNNRDVCTIVKCSRFLNDEFTPIEINDYNTAVDYINNLLSNNIDSFVMTCSIHDPIITSSISNDVISVEVVKDTESVTLTDIKHLFTIGSTLGLHQDICCAKLFNANNFTTIINEYLNEIREKIINFLNS